MPTFLSFDFKFVTKTRILEESKIERDSCEGPLTRTKCWDALSVVKNGKGPVNDGLSKKFHKCF